ncbi:hypothetical protein OH492_20700 [Vibrio chagasii]|nr:hypothetical protein [Vibrio chagasii]
MVGIDSRINAETLNLRVQLISGNNNDYLKPGNAAGVSSDGLPQLKRNLFQFKL